MYDGDFFGRGLALELVDLFTRGGVQVGRWEKTYPTNPLKLYTKSGEEMTLNRGKTYFALVDNDELSNFSYQ